MKNAAKIASLLATVYPAMFKFQEKEVLGRAPSRAGYGLGGIKGLKNLPSTICQRVILKAIFIPSADIFFLSIMISL